MFVLHLYRSWLDRFPDLAEYPHVVVEDHPPSEVNRAIGYLAIRAISASYAPANWSCGLGFADSYRFAVDEMGK